MREYYSLDSLKKIAANPRLIRTVVKRLIQDLRGPRYKWYLSINRRYYQFRYSTLGSDFMAEDWDTLVILDAARPDLLDDVGGFPAADTTTTKHSPASYSWQFMEEQFVGRELHDTVYVTSNPYAPELPDDTFHAAISLLESGWDEETQTVPPEEVVAAAKHARETYPDKRFIVHFMQPHFPFIGETGGKIPAALGRDVGSGTHPWFDQMGGLGVEHNVLIDAFRENHAVVQPHAESIIEDEPGKSVVTADHTNLIGERGFPVPLRQYGHPADFPHPDLLRVPWIVFEGGHRETVPSAPEDTLDVGDDIVNKRLEALGYTD